MDICDNYKNLEKVEKNGFSLSFFKKKGKNCQQYVKERPFLYKYFDGIRFLRKYVEGSWR